MTTLKTSLSSELYQKACQVLPAGVNSPVRAFRNIGRDPIFMQKGQGSFLWDCDDNRYLDFCCSWGPLILGHSHPAILQAVQEALPLGTTFGCATEKEVQLAQMVVDAVPSMEMVRFVNSGTEAVMSAIRLARAVTGRRKILKFEGCYHGHVDSLLVKSGSGVAEIKNSSSAGVPNSLLQDVICIPYNDLEAFYNVIERYRHELAVVALEPVPGNMGVVLPHEGYLQEIRDVTAREGILLLFDEVISGFRLAYGGAQEMLGVTPDLTCLGKIIGGGFPVGAFGGSSAVMQQLAPLGNVYQAGTLSGNPIAMSAGLAALNELKQDGFYSRLNQKAQEFVAQLRVACEHNSKTAVVQSIGTMFTIFFTANDELHNYKQVSQCDVQSFREFYCRALDSGFYLSPSQFETNFVSHAHTEDDLQSFLEFVSRT